MPTSGNKYDSIENIIFQQGLKISSIEFDQRQENMVIILNSSQRLVVPVFLYSALAKALPGQLNRFQIIADGTGIHWPDLDEDLSLKGFLRDYLKQKLETEQQLVLTR